ncbi:DUF6577 family protein [Geobacter sp. DSM 9736]|uniref:DUF6577 family protein n=1 Tax=Geobacter sp. DSM 9736 TaxID=1277350 RepID=UPI000B50A9A5|nr:DUF6577 family protein [Geobacter sp. DSM 9736]SNB47475.1 Eco57I restriction-modification methylase [Geobacter sp. DSM 9736]
MNHIELKQLLQQPYDRAAWQAILRETFPNVSILAQPHAVLCENKDVASFLELGSVRLHDDKKLAIFEVALTPKKKIQRNRVELRNLVARYIDQENNHGVLVIFTGQNEDYRFTFTAKESEFNDDGEFVERQTATKRFTYLLGPHETCTTAARRLSQLAEKQDRATLTDVVDAFSVEKLNKEFFNLYKEHYTTFVNHLLAGTAPQQVFGIPRMADDKEQDKANKPVRDFAKRLLGRLVFLHFIQKKGWLGCPADRTDWINGERDFVRNLFLSCPDKEKFYSIRLVPLFFEALNRPDRPNAIFAVTGTRVPYLNGGLFEHEKLPNDHKPLPVEKLDFPATLFEQLLEFFGQYNFTIDENDPDDHEVGIDPEMLGHIFENLLEDNKDKGAFYTPKAIVQYMCQQSLIHYLQQHLGERDELVQLVRFKDAGSATDKNNWVRQNAKRIEELLDRLKICDPAIGSGAFPIGLLQEIYWIKLTLDWTLDPAETKLKIIQNSIYGVDIDAGAVEIARLRFWLSLIVDEDEPRPLPNLDYKIMQGDSLLESFEGIPLDNLQQSKGFKVEVFSKQGQGQMFPGDLLEFTQSHESNARAKEISSLINKYFDVTNPTEKQELHKQIDRFVLDHIDYNLQIQEEKFSDELQLRKAEIKRKAGLVKGWKPAKKDEQRLAALEDGLKSITLKKEKLQELEEKPERPYFLWHLFFQDVFEQGGFDIFIANPPYVRHETISHYRGNLDHYETAASRADLFVFFYERAVKLLKENGILTFISSNKYYRSAYGEKLRGFLGQQLTINELIDFGDAPVFDAIAYASIIIGSRQSPAENHTLRAYAWDKGDQLNRIAEIVANRGFEISQQSMRSDGWHLESQESLKLLETLTKRGTPLSSYVKGSLYRGIITGYNEAFVLDSITRDTLIAEDPKSAELIKPWLRGRDVKRWNVSWAQLYVIAFPFGFHENLNNYPAILKHLKKHEKKLKERGQCTSSRGGKGEGQHHWLELDNNPKPSYLQEFTKPKVIIPAIERQCAFAYDDEGYYSNDKTSICASEEALFLCSVLNSSVIWWIIQQTAASKQNGYFEFKPMYVAPLPIPDASKADKDRLEVLAQQARKTTGPQLDLIEREINSIVYRLFKLLPDEIAIIEQKPTSFSIDHKSALITRILPALKEKHSYFSLSAVKQTLADAEIELADDTLREYMSDAMSSGIVSDAGRGWYSHHTKPVNLDPKPVAKIIRAVKKAFPLLDFCCWSTVQFNPFALHLIAQPTIFLYAEGDTLNSVAETLKENGWDAWADPGKSEVERYIKPGDRTVILRPSIQKQPESKDQVAPIEKALIDLKIEASKLHLMDSTEVQRIVDAVLRSGLLQVTAFLGYSEAKREKVESVELAH